MSLTRSGVNPADEVGSNAPANARSFIDSLEAAEEAMPVPIGTGRPSRPNQALNVFERMRVASAASGGGGHGGGTALQEGRRGPGRRAGTGSTDNQEACPRCGTVYERGHLNRDHYAWYHVPDADGKIVKRRLCKKKDRALIKELKKAERRTAHNSLPRQVRPGCTQQSTVVAAHVGGATSPFSP